MALQQVDILLAGLRDGSGNPLVSGKVWTYDAGTTTPKTTYQDHLGASAATNPIILDGFGRAQIYAEGAFKFFVEASDGSDLYTWDNLYFSRATSPATYTNADYFGGTSTGSGGAYAITVAATVTSLQNGQIFSFLANHTSPSGSSTLDVNGIGATTLVWGENYSLVGSGDIRAGELHHVQYVSLLASFVLINRSASNLIDFGIPFVGTSGGSANAQTATMFPINSSLRTGMSIRFIAGFTPTAAWTFNLSGLGAKAVKTSWGAAVAGGEIRAGGVYVLTYNGTDFILVNSTPNFFGPFETVTAAGSTQGTATVLSATKFLNRVDGADGTKGVSIPTPTSWNGESRWIHNNASAILKLYPPSGWALNNAATNAAINVPANSPVIVTSIPGLTTLSYNLSA